jgi:hypothetical protein
MKAEAERVREEPTVYAISSKNVAILASCAMDNSVPSQSAAFSKLVLHRQ